MSSKVFIFAEGKRVSVTKNGEPIAASKVPSEVTDQIMATQLRESVNRPGTYLLVIDHAGGQYEVKYQMSQEARHAIGFAIQSAMEHAFYLKAHNDHKRAAKQIRKEALADLADEDQKLFKTAPLEDIMPSDLCDFFDVPQGSTYRQARREFCLWSERVLAHQ